MMTFFWDVVVDSARGVILVWMGYSVMIDGKSGMYTGIKIATLMLFALLASSTNVQIPGKIHLVVDAILVAFVGRILSSHFLVWFQVSLRKRALQKRNKAIKKVLNDYYHTDLSIQFYRFRIELEEIDLIKERILDHLYENEIFDLLILWQGLLRRSISGWEMLPKLIGNNLVHTYLDPEYGEDYRSMLLKAFYQHPDGIKPIIYFVCSMNDKYDSTNDSDNTRVVTKRMATAVLFDICSRISYSDLETDYFTQKGPQLYRALETVLKVLAEEIPALVDKTTLNIDPINIDTSLRLDRLRTLIDRLRLETIDHQYRSLQSKHLMFDIYDTINTTEALHSFGQLLKEAGCDGFQGL